MTSQEILETLNIHAFDFKEKLEQLIDAKIEEALEGSFSDKISDALGDIEPRNIYGLDEFVNNRVSSALESFTIDADNIQNLDSAVQSQVQNLTFTVAVE